MPFTLLKNCVVAKFACLTLAFAMFLFAPTLFAATIVVPTDQPTIQAGIDAAQNGDTVLVNPNTYGGPGNRDIDFGGKAIILFSPYGADSTIINCGGSLTEPHIGFSFHTSEGNTSVVDGFTIMNACGNPTNSAGAISIVNSWPTIQNCIVIQNNCNGVLIHSSAHPRIDNCRFISNSENGVQIGDVISYTSGGMIIECLFRNNGVDGARVYNCDALQFANCTSVKNTHYGFNLIGDLPKNGGSAPRAITIVNSSIAAYNVLGGIIKQAGFHQPAIYCSDSYSNGGFDYVGLDSFLIGDYGNFSADPLFCNLGTSDFGLQSLSPCAPDNNSCFALIGAFNVGCSYLCGDCDENQIITISDPVYLINFIFNAGPPPFGLGYADPDCNLIITISDAVYLINYIFSGGPAPCANCP